MRLLQKFGQLVSKAVTKLAVVDSFARIPLLNFTEVEARLSAGTGKSWASYKSCRLISDVFVTTDYSLQREGTYVPSKQREVQDIIMRPNDQESFSDMLRKWVFHMKLAGVAFWVKDRATEDGTCTGLYALNPKRVKVYVSRGRGVVGYGYFVNGLEIPFYPYEIIAWKLSHPDDDTIGLGDVEGGSTLFTNHTAQVEFQKRFLQAGGTYSRILVHEEPVYDATAWEELKAKWESRYGGASNAGKTAWLSGKWKSIDHGMTIRDMMHVESMKISVEEIFALHGVPPSLAGIRPAENMSSSRTEDIQFRRYTVFPLMALFAEKFNSEFVQKFRPDISFIFNLGGLANIKEIVDDYKDLIAQGAMMPEELRIIAGLDPSNDPLLKKFYIGTHLVPIDILNIDPMDLGGMDGQDNNGITRDDEQSRADQLDRDEGKKMTGPEIVQRLKKNSLSSAARIGASLGTLSSSNRFLLAAKQSESE